MYGWIIDILERHIISKYGIDAWNGIKAKAAESYKQQQEKRDRLLQEERKPDADCIAASSGSTKSRVAPSDFDEDWIVYREYPDEIIFAIVDTASNELSISSSVLLEDVGRCLLDTARAKGYGKMLECQGKSLHEWLSNISEAHSQLQFTVGKNAMGSFPEFFCGEVETEGSAGSSSSSTAAAATSSINSSDYAVGVTPTFLFHYRSKRGKFFMPMVQGVVREGAKVLFGIPELDMELMVIQGENGSSVTTWRIHDASANSTNTMTVESTAAAAGQTAPSHERMIAGSCPMSGRTDLATADDPKSISTRQRSSDGVAPTSLPSSPLVLEDGGLTGLQVKRLFPFHITVNSDFTIKHFGERLPRLVPGVKAGMKMSELFRLVAPTDCVWEWTELELRRDASFTLELLDTHTQSTKGPLADDASPRADDLTGKRVVKLTGGMYVLGGAEDLQRRRCGSTEERGGLAEKKSAIFLIQPDVTDLDDLCELNLTWSDFPHHSPYKKLVYLSEHLKSEMFIGQRSKVEAFTAQHLLDMKRTFVRYISHEVRTPLNTCAVGLRLVQDIGQSLGLYGDTPPSPTDLEKHMGDFQSLLEMIDEIKDSCDVAVEILDDLLLYEKMEGGMSLIESRQEPALKVAYEAVKGLTLQAKDASVQLEFTYAAECFAENEIEKPSVFVNVDKKKIAQAIKSVVFSTISHLRQHNEDPLVTSKLQEKDKPRPKITVHTSVQALATAAASGKASTKASTNNLATLVDTQSHANPLPNQRKVLRIDVRTDTGETSDELSAAVATQLQADHMLHQIREFDLENLESGEGAGLGLFISRGIIEAHGGLLGVLSSPTVTEPATQGQGQGHTHAAAVGPILYMELPVSKFVPPVRDESSLGASPMKKVSDLALQTEDTDALPEVEGEADEPVAALLTNRTYNSEYSLAGSLVVPPDSNDRDDRESTESSSFLDEWRCPVEMLSASRRGSSKRGRGRGMSFASPSAPLATEPPSPHPKDLSVLVSHKLSKIIKSAVSRRPSFEKLINSTLGSPAPRRVNKNSAVFLSRTPSELRLKPNSSTASLSSEKGSVPHAVIKTLPLEHKRSRVTWTPVESPAPSLPPVISGDASPALVVSSVRGGAAALRRAEMNGTCEFLVVDDSESTRKMLSRLLKMGKFCEKAAEAPDGLHAVELVKRSISRRNSSVFQGEGESNEAPKFDVILMDYVMPVMDGPTATKLIRDLGFDGLIVGVTGNVLPADMEYFKQQGADAVLGKPLKLDELRKLLEEYTARKCVKSGSSQLLAFVQQELSADDNDTAASSVSSSPQFVSKVGSGKESPKGSLPPVLGSRRGTALRSTSNLAKLEEEAAEDAVTPIPSMNYSAPPSVTENPVGEGYKEGTSSTQEPDSSEKAKSPSGLTPSVTASLQHTAPSAECEGGLSSSTKATASNNSTSVVAGSSSTNKAKPPEHTDTLSALSVAASVVAATFTRGVTKAIAKAVTSPPAQVAPAADDCFNTNVRKEDEMRMGEISSKDRGKL